MHIKKTMKDIPLQERPVEKGLQYGVNSLTDSELLAIIIRTGSRGESSLELARRILYRKNNQGSLLTLKKFTLDELLQIRGIGKVKALQLLCIGELGRRISKEQAEAGLSFQTPETIARYYMEDLRHNTKEQLLLLLLNTKSRLLGERVISVGTVNTSLISPREIFIEAIKAEAVNIILLHNHPSGEPAPSREDVLVTKRILEAGEYIGIHLLDHIIIGDQKYVSLKESGII